MSTTYDAMWEQVNLDLDAHAGLLQVLGKFYGDIYLSQSGRLQGMDWGEKLGQRPDFEGFLNAHGLPELPHDRKPCSSPGIMDDPPGGRAPIRSCLRGRNLSSPALPYQTTAWKFGVEFLS